MTFDETANSESAPAEPVAAAEDPWTDDRAPVEWVVDRMIVNAAREDVSLDERTLPTAP